MATRCGKYCAIFHNFELSPIFGSTQIYLHRTPSSARSYINKSGAPVSYSQEATYSIHKRVFDRARCLALSHFQP